MARPVTFVAGVVLLLTVLLWAAVIANSATLNSSDPAGNALSSAYGVFLVLALWALLALLLIIAGSRGGMPGWTRVAALLLVPASSAATLAALNLMSGQPGLRWPLVLPVLAPVLLLAFAAWCYFPAAQARVPGIYAGSAVWGTLLLLALLPLPLLMTRKRVGRDRQEQVKTEWAIDSTRQGEARTQENLANFQKLSPESRLWDYMPFTWDDNPLREQALERARLLPTRQADAEQMLADGHGFPLLEIQDLNLVPTPSFCQKAAALLVQHAEEWRATAALRPAYETRSAKIEQYLGAMGWLRGNGCDISGVLRATEATVRSYPAGPGRDLFLEALGRLGTAR
jgi:hypothetical protein